MQTDNLITIQVLALQLAMHVQQCGHTLLVSEYLGDSHFASFFFCGGGILSNVRMKDDSKCQAD